MSKKGSKSHASSGKAGAATFGFASGFGSGSGLTSSSILSYAAEPPNLSPITDPNVVVIFKNLAKKDSTTKAKALEELQSYIKLPGHQAGELEDAILQAWVKCYPRLSIDTDRRVRQLSHHLQGRLSAACGKRIALYLPNLAGSWLAGLYDNDRATARAAQESLKLVFPTSEKLYSLRKIYHGSILQYCRDAILNETAQTLSDERSVSPDDAEAKYVRVISSCIMLISGLLTDLDGLEISKHQDVYDEILHGKVLWKFSHHRDSSIRRAVYRLGKICLDKKPDIFSKDLEAISTNFVYKTLGTDQLGSSTDLLECLLSLTTSYPTIWTDHYQSKKPALDRLKHFISRGSQMGTSHFWFLLTQVLQTVPIIPHELEGITNVLKALHSGVTSKDEPRSNLEAAWTAYINMAEYLCQSLSTADQSELLRELVLPIVNLHIKPLPSQSQWNLPTASWTSALLVKAVRLLDKVLQDAWPDISSSLIADMKASSPEQAKSFETSQDAVVVQGERWASVLAVAAEENSDKETFLREATRVIEEAIALLKSRNGKPYGAASVAEATLRHNPQLLEHDKLLSDNLGTFLLSDVPSLIISGSPSGPKLVPLLLTSSSTDKFEETWLVTVKGLLQRGPEHNEARVQGTDEALQHMLSSPPARRPDARQDPELQSLLVRRIAANVSEPSSELGNSLLSQLVDRRNALLSSDNMETVLSELTESLSISEQAPQAIKSLEAIQRVNGEALDRFIATASGSNLASGLLLLSESLDEDLANEASNLGASLMTTSGSGSESAIFNIISKCLLEASPSSVSAENLTNLAQRLWTETEQDRTQVAERLFPDAQFLDEALAPLLKNGPKQDLSITSPLGGAVYLIDAPESKAPTLREWDASGYSRFVRLLFYISQLVSNINAFEYLNQHHRVKVLEFIVLATQFVDDDITLAGIRGLFDPSVDAEVLTIISHARGIVHGLLEGSKDWWLHSAEHADSLLVTKLTQTLFDSATGVSAQAYYYALAYTTIVRELVELHGRPATINDQTPQATLDIIRKTEDDVRLIAFSTAMQSSLARTDQMLTILNGLIATLTGLSVEEHPQKILRQLVLLNVLLQLEDAPTERVAKQRVVFFVQHILRWIAHPGTPLPIQAEVLRSLSSTIGYMKDMYGSHWTNILDMVIDLWKMPLPKANGWLPLLHSSFRLFGTLRSLSEEEDANDDLLDAWKDVQVSAAEQLVSVLKQLESKSKDAYQPQKIVDELLARQIARTPLQNYDGLGELYPLIQSRSESIQRTAFAILDAQIPLKQEQVSFDAALDKKDAQLPEELLSMVLEAPATGDIEEIDFRGEMPPALRAYLLSWLLVFDHFKNSSYKVKADYIENIKEGGYLNSLLDLVSHFLKHDRGKAVDASKFNIIDYDANLESLPEQDTQWLSVHLFYLSLKHTPSIVKTWWIECRSRQKVISIESWTEKYISPLIITDALESASEWAEAQDGSAEEQLTVKVNHRAKEVAASYVVDEQTMKILISLPDAYPLQQARVEGVSRVAVEEKKWQSWLINCRGVITFSNGSIPDGLSAWRKNVIGALKGQTECAICYSIISADKQLPSKRCSTCKNLFHSSCLFKWFKSSNASTCPLCRNPFNYG